MKNTFVIAILLTCFASAATVAEGDASAGKEKVTACAACHGTDGNSQNPEWPKLAGQGAKYLNFQLSLFKSGARQNALMSPQAANLSEQDMHDIAAYYASLPTSPGAASEELVSEGEAIYRGGIAAKGVAACMGCHGPDGAGNPPALFPKVSGQHAAYTVATLKAYRQGERKYPGSEIMNAVTERLTDHEMAAVAQYMAGLH